MAKPKKLYTISTYVWDNLEDVKNQMLKWEARGTLNSNTRIFVIKSEINWKKKIETEKEAELW